MTRAFYRVTPELWSQYRHHFDFVQNIIAEKEINLLIDILHKGNLSGELNVKKIEPIAHMMVISLKALEYPWALAGYSYSLKEYIDLMVDTIFKGIGAKN